MTAPTYGTDYHRAHYLANRAPLTKRRRLRAELDVVLKWLVCECRDCRPHIERAIAHIELARAIFEPEDSDD